MSDIQIFEKDFARQRIFGLPVVVSEWIPTHHMVEPTSGDNKNPYPRFGLRARKVPERIVMMAGRNLMVSPENWALITEAL